MNLKQLVRLLDINLASLRKGLVHGKRVTELLYSLIEDVGFEDLKIPFAAVAVDTNTGKEVIIREGSVVEAVRASISIPAIFLPVRFQDKTLIDGGIVNPVPTDILVDMGAKFIIAVNVLAGPHKMEPINILPKGKVPDILTTLIQAIYIMEYEIIKSKTVNADIIITPDVSHIEAFEFHRGEEAILAGYEATKTILPELRELTGQH